MTETTEYSNEIVFTSHEKKSKLDLVKTMLNED